jgi:hypothetical protein
MNTISSDGTVTPPTINFTEEGVKTYLDRTIEHWRKCAPTQMQKHYVDAFQSMRVSLFGELLPKEGE